MDIKNQQYKNQGVQAVVALFTVENSTIKVLLKKREEEPYKGYWMLPGGSIYNDETLEEGAKREFLEGTSIQVADIEQFHVFSDVDRYEGSARMFAVGFVGFINQLVVGPLDPLQELEWFSIDVFPKLAFDHSEILERSIKTMRKKLHSGMVLKELVSGTFTLPELQSLYEVILGEPVDRRNFRKKFLSLGIIEETGFFDDKKSGRPAKLYLLKEDIDLETLF